MPVMPSSVCFYRSVRSTCELHLVNVSKIPFENMRQVSTG